MVKFWSDPVITPDPVNLLIGLCCARILAKPIFILRNVLSKMRLFTKTEAWKVMCNVRCCIFWATRAVLFCSVYALATTVIFRTLVTSITEYMHHFIDGLFLAVSTNEGQVHYYKFIENIYIDLTVQVTCYSSFRVFPLNDCNLHLGLLVIL